jgi:hypothetical protein
VKSGTVANFDLSPRQRDDRYAFRFVGRLDVASAGEYTFHLTSDDGSWLLIDGALVINNDGLHSAYQHSGSVNLAAGARTIEVEFFEYLGSSTLVVEIEGPGLPRQAVPTSLLTHDPSGGTGESQSPPPLAPLTGGGGSLTGGSGSLTGGSETGNESGDFSRSQPRIRLRYQPDNWIGTRMTSQIGDGIFNTTGLSQSVKLKLKRGRSRGFYFTVENDRRVPDTVKIQGSRTDRHFGLTYLQLTRGLRNVTGELSAGELEIEALPPSERITFKALVKPGRKLRGRGKTRRISILSISSHPGVGRDRVRATLKKKR